MYQTLIEYLDARRILLLGYGREGQSSHRFIREHLPQKSIGIADVRVLQTDDPLVTLHTGERYLDALGDYDLILQSPGISLRDVRVPDGTEISGQTDLFLRFAPCEKIGITGTKGKTTTSHLIYEVLCAADRPALLIGNMGVPVFDALAECGGKTAVMEMSSHQLEFAKASPRIAVFTNIFPEHLDHYNGFDGYAIAKMNIARFQTPADRLFYDPHSAVPELPGFTQIRSAVTPVDPDDASFAYLGDVAALNGRLLGNHNRRDACFAAAVAASLGIENEAVLKGLRAFRGAEHRMEPVGEFRGIRFYDDSIATVPDAVLPGLHALPDTDTLIVGGLDRGLDYTDFAVALDRSALTTVICMPETGLTIGRLLEDCGSAKRVVYAQTMEQAVNAAYAHTRPGRVCLLSPAAASYSHYKNFEEKGDHFRQLVREIGSV